MAAQEGWPALFDAAFKQSRNAMVLLDARRRHVDVNGAYLRLLGRTRAEVVGEPMHRFVAGGPHFTAREWAAALAKGGHYSGESELVTSTGDIVAVQWGATVETVTGQRLVLLVAASTSRWGPRFRRDVAQDGDGGALSGREGEIVRLVAMGSTGPEIADELQIAPDTVRTHVRNAMTKVGARSRAHLVAKALGDGHVAA